MAGENTTSEMSHPRHSSLNSSSLRPRCCRQGRSSKGMSGEGMAERKTQRGGGTPAARQACRNSNAIQVPTLCATTYEGT